MYREFGLFIAGKWESSTETSATVVSPVTEKVLGDVATATISDTKRAIDAAELALTKLREMGGLRSRRRSSQDCRRNGQMRK